MWPPQLSLDGAAGWPRAPLSTSVAGAGGDTTSFTSLELFREPGLGSWGQAHGCHFVEFPAGLESLSSFYLGCRGAGPPPLLDPIMPHVYFQSRHGDCTSCPVHTLPRTSCWVCPLHAQGLWHDRTDTQPLFVPGLPWRACAVSWLYLLQTPESSAPPTLPFTARPAPLPLGLG